MAFNHRFVLEALDPATGCPVTEVGCSVPDLTIIASFVDPDDFNPAATYELEHTEVAELSKSLGLSLTADPAQRVQLRPWHPLDDLPYRESWR